MDSIFEQFCEKLKSLPKKNTATIVFLKGDLGSGKTTFVKNLCLFLNIKVDIHSPTFVIMKVYDFLYLDYKKMIHIDAYRLKSFNDLATLKIDEYIRDRDNVVFIEWPDIVESEVLKPDIQIEFEHVFDNYLKKEDRFVKIL